MICLNYLNYFKIACEKFPNHSAAWKKDGFLEAVKVILTEKNTLFESMINKLQEYPELKQMIYEILFQGGKSFKLFSGSANKENR